MNTTPWIRHEVVPQEYALGNVTHCLRCGKAVPVPAHFQRILCQKDDAWLFGDEPKARDCQ
jgi:hypothetical protein